MTLMHFISPCSDNELLEAMREDYLNQVARRKQIQADFDADWDKKYPTGYVMTEVVQPDPVVIPAEVVAEPAPAKKPNLFIHILNWFK